MNESLISVFKEGIVAISDGIKGLAPHVWEIVVRQQVAYGYAYLFGAIMSLLIFIGSLIGAFKTNNGDWCFVFCMGALVSCICLIMFGIDSVLHLFSPEYYALMDLKSIILP